MREKICLVCNFGTRIYVVSMENRNTREKTKRDAVQLLEELLRNKEREVHTIASAKLNKNLADLIRSVMLVVKMENIMNPQV